MKKILATTLIFLFVLGIAGCGNSSAMLPEPVTKTTESTDGELTILDDTVPLAAAPSDFTPHKYAQEVLDLVNQERAAANLAPLMLNPRLCEAAQLRAEESVKSFSHTRPDGSLCFSVLDEYSI
ncbi:MAG: CAP domain-containing protein, partial [Bacillota bacterium]|nr:CAP domain-containing protein [Bacillota bacterium]